ncbi:MAG: hypothetical protein AAF483_15790 [Planctomycetota bacterium]
MSGIDFLASKRNHDQALFYEHQGSRAVRLGDWKLVNEGKSNRWELYRLDQDAIEQNDLGQNSKGKRKTMETKWIEWARNVGARHK